MGWEDVGQAIEERFELCDLRGIGADEVLVLRDVMGGQGEEGLGCWRLGRALWESKR